MGSRVVCVPQEAGGLTLFQDDDRKDTVSALYTHRDCCEADRIGQGECPTLSCCEDRVKCLTLLTGYDRNSHATAEPQAARGELETAVMEQDEGASPASTKEVKQKPFKPNRVRPVTQTHRSPSSHGEPGRTKQEPGAAESRTHDRGSDYCHPLLSAE
ncbi:unnamed protein product [Arctogadus glacialis]